MTLIFAIKKGRGHLVKIILHRLFKCFFEAHPVAKEAPVPAKIKRSGEKSFEIILQVYIERQQHDLRVFFKRLEPFRILGGGMDIRVVKIPCKVSAF